MCDLVQHSNAPLALPRCLLTAGQKSIKNYTLYTQSSPHGKLATRDILAELLAFLDLHRTIGLCWAGSQNETELEWQWTFHWQLKRRIIELVLGIKLELKPWLEH